MECIYTVHIEDGGDGIGVRNTSMRTAAVGDKDGHTKRQTDKRLEAPCPHNDDNQHVDDNRQAGRQANWQADRWEGGRFIRQAGRRQFSVGRFRQAGRGIGLWV